MDSPHDNASFRGGAPGEDDQSDQPIQLAGSELGAKRHVWS
jgi:hypothetical protein